MDDKNTILCRCEDLTREDILKCIQDGYRTIDEIKRVTRAGMGPDANLPPSCQTYQHGRSGRRLGRNRPGWR